MLVLAVALVAGLLAGYACGGRLGNLERLRLRAPWLVLLALVVQLVIFSPLGAPLSDTAVVTLHLASYALLLVFVAANLGNGGVVIAGAGIVLNTAVIAANGGYMPASTRALEIAGRAAETEPYNNSALAENGTHLLPLGDVFAVPDWVPLVANVFSVGDVLIAAGVAVMLASAMRGPESARPRRQRARRRLVDPFDGMSEAEQREYRGWWWSDVDDVCHGW